MLDASSDSLRSSVSSPGMPNTYLTPSASRHSTNRSDALRSLISATSYQARCRATLIPLLRLISLTLAALALLATPAFAAKARFTIRGAGFGHGVGMSQYGAYGFAQHGRDLRPDPGPLLHGHASSGRPIRRATVRVLIQSTGTASFSGAVARRHAHARTRPHLQGAPPRRHAGRPAVGGRQADRHLLGAAPGLRARTTWSRSAASAATAASSSSGPTPSAASTRSTRSRSRTTSPASSRASRRRRGRPRR